MRACWIAFAILLAPSGCCLSTISGDAGVTLESATSNGTGGGATNGTTGTSTGTSTGTANGSSTGGSTGGATTGGPTDAGTCLIDGQVVPAGTWLDTFYGSCTFCDPATNPNNWTELDAGSPCRTFASGSPQDPFNGPQNIPLEGACLKLEGIRSQCTCIIYGEGCGGPQQWACCGGSCDHDSGLCSITQNVGWPSDCNGSLDTGNRCAQGPCCVDAGGTAGWCCGLVDGGEPTCLGAGSVCFESSNCCGGLGCHPDEAIFDGGESFGVCE